MTQGIIEVVDKPESGDVGKVHYLQHHAVIQREKQTTKLRIVYDASARTKAVSLNDCLHTGPTFGQNIMDIFLRFRSHKVALAADIEKAFLMISMAERDQDALRFLWVDDVIKAIPNVVVLRFTQVAFGVSSSPFLLNATVKHYLERYCTEDPSFVNQFLQSIYVDDVAYGEDDDAAAFKLYRCSKLRLAEGGFNLRKFVTNSRRLMEQIDIDEGGTRLVCINVDTTTDDKFYAKSVLGGKSDPHGEEQKILGVCWNFIHDQLVFDLTDIAQYAATLEPTKRNIVGVSAKFYDSLGLVSPVTVQFKLLFKALCEAKLE